MTKEIVVYKDTLENIEKTSGEVLDFMKAFPMESPVHERHSWKSLGEIDRERARYLLSTDEMLEEMLSEKK